jgi:hypothetical protein
MIDIISQIGIMTFGATATFLVGTKGRWQRYGYILGLLAQPFWYITTYRHEQWGIFFLSLFYTFSWINGVRNHFFNKGDK